MKEINENNNNINFNDTSSNKGFINTPESIKSISSSQRELLNEILYFSINQDSK